MDIRIRLIQNNILKLCGLHLTPNKPHLHTCVRKENFTSNSRLLIFMLVFDIMIKEVNFQKGYTIILLYVITK